MEHWIVDGRDGKAWLLFDENAEQDAPFIKFHGSHEAAQEVARRLNEAQPK
jgi:hypothetical protein